MPAAIAIARYPGIWDNKTPDILQEVLFGGTKPGRIEVQGSIITSFRALTAAIIY